MILSDGEGPVEVAAPVVTKMPEPKENMVALWRKAVAAGDAALAACTPTPMIVTEHANPLDDNSAPVKKWFVSGGVCGFAEVRVPYKGKGITFINAMKKAGMAGERKAWSKHYHGGYYYWVSVGGQSMQLKEAWARAAAEVLCAAGIDAWMTSRMD